MFRCDMTTCADIVNVLGSANHSVSTDLLPISVSENCVCILKYSDSFDSLENDTMFAPQSIAACDVTLTPENARVRAGAPAVFRLTSAGSIPHEGVITALASCVEVLATLHISSADGGVVDAQVPVGIEASAELYCVLLIVAVPPSTPDGAFVIINNVWVAGCAVKIAELLSFVTIGFNHAPASAGAMYAAAAAGDVPGLIAALQSGESTEQRSGVSVGKN